MKATSTESTAQNISIRPPPDTGAFNALIVYEDYTTGRLAMELCERLIEQSVGGSLLQPHFWKLGDLQHPEALEGMLEAAATADMFIVAAQETTVLSPDTMAKFELGLKNR